jgi:putative transposase
MSGQYKVAWLCEALLVSRSGYYDWKERRRTPGPRQVENARLRERIRQEFARSRQTYGSPRLAHVLGCPGRRNRIARLMRKERLFARQRSKYRPATTDSRHGGPIAPNCVQNLTVQRPDQVWATDATCVLTGQGWFVSGRSPGSLLPARRRLGDESNPRCPVGHRCPAHGPRPTSPRRNPHRPL